jgi:hypothetical protein
MLKAIQDWKAESLLRLQGFDIGNHEEERKGLSILAHNHFSEQVTTVMNKGELQIKVWHCRR